MHAYQELLRQILQNGESRDDRTGTGTLSIFGYQSRYDLALGFPLVTTKKCHLKSIVHELLWFLSGDTNVQYLRENGVSIWDEWADANGDLGPVYGYQWRHWGQTWKSRVGSSNTLTDFVGGIDQIAGVIQNIRDNPKSRRHIVSAWNCSDLEQMALPPCHTMFQFFVHEDRRLSCQLYQRSADAFLGVPFNIASYALLTMMVAQVVDLRPGLFIHTLGDAHLYRNHIEQAKLQLTRDPRPLPTMHLNPAVRDIFEYKFSDFRLEGYDPHPAIRAEISV